MSAQEAYDIIEAKVLGRGPLDVPAGWKVLDAWPPTKTRKPAEKKELGSQTTAAPSADSNQKAAAATRTHCTTKVAGKKVKVSINKAGSKARAHAICKEMDRQCATTAEATALRERMYRETQEVCAASVSQESSAPRTDRARSLSPREHSRSPPRALRALGQPATEPTRGSRSRRQWPSGWLRADLLADGFAGGTVIDGTGAPPFVADIAVDGETITTVGPNLDVTGGPAPRALRFSLDESHDALD